MGLIQELHDDLENGVSRLIREYHDRLFADAVRLCGDATQAEDLVITTFDKAIRNINSYKVDANFFGWLKTILLNLHRDDRRHPVRSGTLPVDSKTLEDRAGADWRTDDQILRDSDGEALREAIKRLDPEFKKAMVLHYFGDLPVKEIAYVMKCPVGTVLWRLNVARKMLAHDLGEKLGRRKPLAIILALALLSGTLFGAWQAARMVFADDPPVESVISTETKGDKPMTTQVFGKKVQSALGAAAATIALGVAPVEAQPISDGMAAYYTFDETMPSNHAPSGAVTGVTFSASGVESDVRSGEFGHFGFGGYLDLNNGDVRLDGSENLEFENGNDFTVVVWMRTEAKQSGDPVAVGNGDWSHSSKPGVLLVVNGTPECLYNYSVGGTSRVKGMCGAVTTGEWDFYALTHTADGKFRCYRSGVDGKLATVSEVDAPDFKLTVDNPAERLPFYLGQDGLGGYGKTFVGKLDEFALWTRGLAAADVAAIYENGRKGRTLDRLLEPTVSAGETDGDAVEVSIVGDRSETYGLYVGSGAVDAGADRFAWDHFDFVTEIGPAVQTYRFTLPDAFKAEARYYRFFLMKNDTGYQELEFIQNTDSGAPAYFVSEVKPTVDTAVMSEIEVVDGVGWDNVFGCFHVKTDDTPRCFYQFGFNWTHKTWYSEITKDEPKLDWKTKEFGSGAAGVRYDFEYTVTRARVWEPAGVTTVQPLLSDRALFAGCDDFINVFRCEKIDGATSVIYDTALQGKMYAFAIATNGTLACDYVPAKDGTGAAGLYDTISGTFHPSESATAFVGGPAVDGCLSSVSELLKAATDTDPVTAYWIGGVNGALDDPACWHCENRYGRSVTAVPQVLTVVNVASADQAFDIPAEAGFECKELVLGDSVVLTRNVDWRGIDLSKVSSLGAVDLSGRDLRLSASDAIGNLVGFTDTVGGGALHVEVQQGKTVTNAKVPLGGALTLVKDGAGILIADCAGQSNTGGVRVESGTLKTVSSLDSRVLGPVGSKVMVKTGATLQIENGYTGLEDHDVELAGGTLHMLCNVAKVRSVIGSLSLTANSVLALESTLSGDASCDVELSEGAVWDLGGCILSVQFRNANSDLWLGKEKSVKPVLKNGTVVLDSSIGYWQDYGVDASEGVCYRFGMQYVRQRADAKVFDFVNNVPASSANVTSDGTLSIYGTYTPNSGVCCKLRMMDGSTIALGGLTSAWSVALGGERVVSYENGATVNIDLGTRKLGSNHKIVSWDAIPTGVEFVDPTKKYTFTSLADGLYAYRGFVMLIK